MSAEEIREESSGTTEEKPSEEISQVEKTVQIEEACAEEAAQETTEEKPKRKHPWIKRVLLVLLALIVVAGIALALAVQHRLQEKEQGIGVVEAPETTIELTDSSGKTGSFDANISFTSMATGDETIGTTVAWDDNWFFEDPAEYNHELATTCSVLSAVANSESSYYQAGSHSKPFMEQALSALGFDEISTSSYQYRSEIFDEVVDFIVGTDDVVAYSVATKHLVNDEGKEKTLYLVSIRGSYGSEWLSDLQMGDASDYEMEAIDHEGFMLAANEIMEDLAVRITEEAQDKGIDDIALLFCGHSRGAAVANIAAAYADDMTLGLRSLAPLDSIYCYTFATPEVTTVDVVEEGLYNNIFNIMNPSDLVPRLPLAQWGYARYGNDLLLPGYGDEGFDARYEEMCDAFTENTGVECPYVPEDREAVDKLIDDLGTAIPEVEDLTSLGGMTALIKDLMSDINPIQVLYGHYPSVYIAWMQSIDAEELQEV